MRIIFALAAGVALIAVLLWALITTPAADLARRLRMAGGAALIALGAGLVFMRQVALAVPFGMAGFMILRRQAGMRSAGGSGQRRSTVRSARLEMMLDHETGEMDGRVLSGRQAGRALSGLPLNDLLELAEELRGDPESLRLLETYLDRAHPGWREDVQADDPPRQSPPPRPGGMNAQEAYEILGLEPGAGEAEVREAHRRLMKQVHPDRGGSAALAAKINEAKDRILGKHG